MSYSLEYRDFDGSRGFANNSNSIDGEIIFGERNIISAENSISGAYNFNPFHSLTLSLRNFWSTVTYDDRPFFLQQNGSLIESTNTFEELGLGDSNVNFNTWNLDFRYQWQFAPGSFLTALYRNSLFNQTTSSGDDYFQSLEDLFGQDMNHIFSLRLQYFIDYNNLKGVFKKKTAS